MCARTVLQKEDVMATHQGECFGGALKIKVTGTCGLCLGHPGE
jgi:hypothetical protein